LPEGQRDHQGRPAGGAARGGSSEPAQLRPEVPGRDQRKTGAARLPHAGRADQSPGLGQDGRVRHQKAGRKFSRSTAHRKELRRWVEKVITTAKNDNVAARRAVDAIVEDREVTERLFSKLMPRMKERTGGYTRVLKIGPRQGDAAPMVLVELVDR